MKCLVFSEHPDGRINRWEIFADSKEEAEARVRRMFPDEPITATAFDWYIQFKSIRPSKGLILNG